jgi:hypothetical protein
MGYNMESMYFSFVRERHSVWEKRQAGQPGPWTNDPWVAAKKFTNVFRILDPGTQYALTLGALDERDILLRLFLYRHTGRIDAWEYLDALPTAVNLPDVLAQWQDYRALGGKIFTSAYVVAPGPGTDKMESVIDLTRRMFTPGSPDDIIPAWQRAESPRDRFAALHRNHGVGDFMSMQILTDWGYHFSSGDENAFVVAGPGSRKGAAELDRGSPEDTIRWARDEWWLRADCPVIDLPDGRQHPPSLMDVQNTFCEFSKYLRYIRKGPVPTKPYAPAHPGPQPKPRLPAHW